MSKTDAQSGPVALSKLKCCKNSNLDGKTMENPPILPRASLEIFTFPCVFVPGDLFVEFFFGHQTSLSTKPLQKV